MEGALCPAIFAAARILQPYACLAAEAGREENPSSFRPTLFKKRARLQQPCPFSLILPNSEELNSFFDVDFSFCQFFAIGCVGIAADSIFRCDDAFTRNKAAPEEECADRS